jgi:hypothetical protein
MLTFRSRVALGSRKFSEDIMNYIHDYGKVFGMKFLLAFYDFFS